SVAAAFLVAIPEITIGQLHDDDELTVDDVVALKREDVWMSNGFDSAEGLEFLLGARSVVARGLQIAVDKLDGFHQAAGGFGLPDFAEAAAADPFYELVAGDRLDLTFNPDRHRWAPARQRPSATASPVAAQFPPVDEGLSSAQNIACSGAGRKMPTAYSERPKLNAVAQVL